MPTPTTPSEAIIARLLATSGVTALVSQNVFPVMPKQDTPGDYIVVTKTSGGGGMRLTRPTKLNQYSMRVDCYAASESAAEAILAQVVLALGGWRDVAGSLVQGCFATADADEQITDDLGGGVFKVSGQTFSLFFQG